jgi:thioredoxin reductase (NADPH)
MMYNFFMQEVNFDVIIIGGGPSGLSAAIYASRAMLKTLVIAGAASGSQLTITTEIENFPGYPDGITGPDLINKLRKQAEKFGSKLVDENATKVSGSFEESFKIQTESGTLFNARSVIVATGASAKWLGLESEEKFKGKGVSVCATCDGFFYKNKTIAVVGGGDAAMEEATYLTKFANKIYVLVRGEKSRMKASKFMQEKAFGNGKIEFLFNTTVEEIIGEHSVKGLKVKNVVTGEIYELPGIEGVFVAVGHSPNTKFLADFVELDEKGYIKLYNGTRSSRDGVFVAGDVADFKYRQAITAAAYGCSAAIDAARFLSEHDIETKSTTN